MNVTKKFTSPLILLLQVICNKRGEDEPAGTGIEKTPSRPRRADDRSKALDPGCFRPAQRPPYRRRAVCGRQTAGCHPQSLNGLSHAALARTGRADQHAGLRWGPAPGAL